MDVRYEGDNAVISGLKEFEPCHIFDNGQAFRFTEKAEGVYEGVAYGRFLRVSKRGGEITLHPCNKVDFEGIWRNYFDLDRDYAALFGDCEDKALEAGRCHAAGLRILNQQPFETLISFIISANNNIGRIRGIIERICKKCGTPFEFEGKEYYAFPEPEQLASLSKADLVECGCGYRAPYIEETTGEIAEGYDLDSIRNLPYVRAKKELMHFKGVGPKVADCVLLFAFSKTDAFPADVWIKRVMSSLYSFSGNDREIYEFAKKRFGECSGIAQQYLFYYARENKLI